MRQVIVQHVADRVVASAEHLRIEISDNAEHRRANCRRPDESAFYWEMIEEILNPE